jgi:hypothetical protein|tara:strand:- start:1573 stop:1734 length:162 start_codon:yes stop_codon:yes gene_type:complete
LDFELLSELSLLLLLSDDFDSEEDELEESESDDVLSLLAGLPLDLLPDDDPEP